MWFKVSCARYGEEGKRLCFWGMKGSVWWKNSNQITSEDGLLVKGWLFENISREVGDGASTLFWKDIWINDFSLEVSFSRLFELADNKLAYVADIFLLG